MKLPDDDLKRSKHVGVVLCVLKCFKWKLYRCTFWLIFEVNLWNAQSNDEIHTSYILEVQFLVGSIRPTSGLIFIGTNLVLRIQGIREVSEVCDTALLAR